MVACSQPFKLPHTAPSNTSLYYDLYLLKIMPPTQVATSVLGSNLYYQCSGSGPTAPQNKPATRVFPFYIRGRWAAVQRGGYLGDVLVGVPHRMYYHLAINYIPPPGYLLLWRHKPHELSTGRSKISIKKTTQLTSVGGPIKDCFPRCCPKRRPWNMYNCITPVIKPFAGHFPFHIWWQH